MLDANMSRSRRTVDLSAVWLDEEEGEEGDAFTGHVASPFKNGRHFGDDDLEADEDCDSGLAGVLPTPDYDSGKLFGRLFVQKDNEMFMLC